MTSSPSTLRSLVNESWSKIWWLRGAGFSLALVSILDGRIAVSAYDFLIFSHAVMTLWSDAMHALGQLLAHIPFVPELSEPYANSLVICLAVIIPPQLSNFALHQHPLFYVRWCLMFFVMTPVFFWYWAWLFMTNAPLLALALGAVGSYSIFRHLLASHPTFAKGMFQIVTALVMLEFLYFLQLPYLSEWMDAFTCQRLQLEDPRCR